MRGLCFPLLLLPLLTAQDPVVRTGAVEWQGRILVYELRGGFAVAEGDIILGPIEEIERLVGEQRGIGKLDPRRPSIVINFGPGAQHWPDGLMYYTIDSDIPNRQRIVDAITHWNSRTRLRLQERTTEPNYVRFRRNATLDAACSSALGMRGGEQTIETTDVCSFGAVIHEIGHAFGLLHEQQRSDRNGRVTVLYHNIDKRFVNNFDTGGGQDAGYYDYGSIMHYFAAGFTRDGLTSLETVPPGIPIGQLLGLSAGDIAAVEAAYGFAAEELTTITSVPVGLRVVIDGVERVTPYQVNWAAGTQHRLAVPVQVGTTYRWVRWSDDGNPDHTIVAGGVKVFCAIYQVRVRAAAVRARGNGTVTLLPRNTDGTYAQRSLIRVKADPAEGNVFQSWTGTSNFDANGKSIFASEATLEVTGIGNLDYQALFGPSVAQTIETVPPGRILFVDGIRTLAPAHFDWPAGSTHEIRLTADQIEGNNTVRHEFQQWEDDSRATTRRIVATGSNVYRATFLTKYLLTIGTVGTGTVRVEPSSLDNFYASGSTVRVTAQPGPGVTLRYWLADLTGGDLSMDVPMTEQKVISANFATPIAFRILHAATYLSNGRWNTIGTEVAPGAIVTVFGTDIGPAGDLISSRVENGRLATELGGVGMTFDGIPAPLIYVSQHQISAVVPYGIGASPVARLSRDGVVTSGLTISSSSTVPGLFTADSSGKGLVAALNQNGSIHSVANPAASGSVIVLYATGAGVLTADLGDGAVTGSRLVGPRAPVWVKLGKLDARVLYAGTAPGLVNGVIQVNVEIPADQLPGDAVPIQLAIGSATSPPGTTIAVR